MEGISGNLQGGGLPRNTAPPLKISKNSQFQASLNLQQMIQSQAGSGFANSNHKSASAFHQQKLAKGVAFEASSSASTPNGSSQQQRALT